MADSDLTKAKGAWAAVLPDKPSELIELDKLIRSMTSSPGWPAFVALLGQRAERITVQFEPVGNGDTLPSYEAHLRGHALAAALRQAAALPAVVAEKAKNAEAELERKSAERADDRD